MNTSILIDRLKAYRDTLKKNGKLLEARAVERCIEIAKRSDKPLGADSLPC